MEYETFDIHVRTLRDNQQYNDPDGIAEALGVSPSSWPLFGLLWESGEVLAQIMLTWDVAGKRILEIGCGVALASLVLNRRGADITATDYHPEAGPYLAWNVNLNAGRPIPFVRTGWRETCEQLGRFDLIIGADLLYEPDHPVLLARFIADHASPGAHVIIVDPSRGRFAKFGRELAGLGFEEQDILEAAGTKQSLAFKGQIRRFAKT